MGKCFWWSNANSKVTPVQSERVWSLSGVKTAACKTQLNDGGSQAWWPWWWRGPISPSQQWPSAHSRTFSAECETAVSCLGPKKSKICGNMCSLGRRRLPASGEGTGESWVLFLSGTARRERTDWFPICTDASFGSTHSCYAQFLLKVLS